MVSSHPVDLEVGHTPVARRTRSQLRAAEQEPSKADVRAEQPVVAPVTPDNPEPFLAPEPAPEPPEPEAPPQPTQREVAAALAARARMADREAGQRAVLSGAADDALPAGALPTGPEPASADVEYPAAADLQPVEDPEQRCQAVVPALSSADWLAVVAALTMTRRLIAAHPAVLEPNLPVFVPLLLKGVKNLRSSVCKTALMCTLEAFGAFGAAILPLADLGGVSQPATSLLHQILLRAANDKRFLQEEAQRAAAAFARIKPQEEVLTTLLAYVAHKNPKVRGQAGKTLMTAVAAGPPEALSAFGTERLLKAAGALISDNTPDARNAARDLVALVKAAFQTEHQDRDGKENSSAAAGNGGGSPEKSPPTPWEAICRRALSGSTAAAVLRVSGR